MLPIVVDVSKVRVALVGTGEAARKRFEQIERAGAKGFKVYGSAPDKALAKAAGKRYIERLPEDGELVGLRVLFTAGLERAEAIRIAGIARSHGILINTEDVKPLCDFHVPSMIRRGDLVFTISTGGSSPALASLLREDLAHRFGPEWEERTKEVAAWRDGWRRDGHDPKHIADLTRDAISERGWL